MLLLGGLRAAAQPNAPTYVGSTRALTWYRGFVGIDSSLTLPIKDTLGGAFREVRVRPQNGKLYFRTPLKWESLSDGGGGSTDTMSLSARINALADSFAQYYTMSEIDGFGFLSSETDPLSLHISDTGSSFVPYLRKGDSTNYTTVTRLRDTAAAIRASFPVASAPYTAGYGLGLTVNDFRVDTSLIRTVANSYSKSQSDAAYYKTSNPSGYITSSALTPYLTTASAAGLYYPLTNPSGYITASALGPYVTAATASSLYVAKTDTTTLLANYVTTAGWGLLKSAKSLGVDSTLVRTVANSYTKAQITSILAGYQPLPAGTSLEYVTGDGSLATLNTSIVAELTNLYFTNARARSALSATLPAVYNTSTGAISLDTVNATVNNVPSKSFLLANYARNGGNAIGSQVWGSTDASDVKIIRQGLDRLSFTSTTTVLNMASSPTLTFTASGITWGSFGFGGTSAGSFSSAGQHTFRNLAGSVIWLNIGTNGTTITGSSSAVNNALTVNNSSGSLKFKIPNSTNYPVLADLPEYADNTAAQAALHYKNGMYHTAGVIKFCNTCTTIAP